MFLSITGLSLLSRGSDYPVHHNTIITGDTTIIRFSLGHYDINNLRAGLSPYDLYHPYDDCPVCKDDSIWCYKIELEADTIFDFYFAVPLGTLPGKYDMFVDFEENPVVSGKRIYIHTPPYIYQQPVDRTVCEAVDSVRFDVKALGNDANDLLYEWYHNENKHSELYDGLFVIEYPLLQDTGNYFCIISNQYGIDTTNTVRLDKYPAPSNPGLPVGPDRFCPGTESTEYSINIDSLAIGYVWYLFPEEAGTVQQGDTSVLIIWNQAFSGIAGLHVELISSHCGNTPSEILEITIPGLSTPRDICIVGIDEGTGKYRIVWEKSGYESVQLFKIYRESNQADVYLEIGTMDPNELCVFIDPASVPDMLSHRYKISYIDSCSNESELSAYHQTIHLTANLGTNNEVNLIWSEYKGIPFPTYDIYRGNHPDSMSLLIQVPSTVTSFKDDNPSNGIVYYQIGMLNPAGCNPAKKADPDYSSSKSNMEQVNISGIEGINETSILTIYPNPAEKVLRIRIKDAYTGIIRYAVYNSLGAMVLEGMMREGSANMDVSSLSPGMYILQLSADMETFSTRFVINNKNY